MTSGSVLVLYQMTMQLFRRVQKGSLTQIWTLMSDISVKSTSSKTSSPTMGTPEMLVDCICALGDQLSN